MAEDREKITLTYEGGGEIIESSRSSLGLSISETAEWLAMALQPIFPEIGNHLKKFKP